MVTLNSHFFDLKKNNNISTANVPIKMKKKSWHFPPTNLLLLSFAFNEILVAPGAADDLTDLCLHAQLVE